MRLYCKIPDKLPSVSKYVLAILQERFALNLDVELEERLDYSFRLGEHEFHLPAYFVNQEVIKWMEKRETFEYSLTEFVFRGEKYIGISDRTNETDNVYNMDVFGTIFILLSRYEEHVQQEKCFDKYNRFKLRYAINREYLETPLVDELVSLFGQMMEQRFGIIGSKPNHNFKVLPSHDVDRPYEYLYHTKSRLMKRCMGDILVRKSLKLAAKRVTNFIKVKKGDLFYDPYNTFEWLMEQSEKYQRKSTFHFITKVTNPVYDQEYKLENPEIESLIRRIHERGHWVGIHPSYQASEMEGQVLVEFDYLKKACERIGVNQTIYKNRYHYLRWNNQSVNELDKAAVGIDQTLTFAEKPGFRCGTSIQYPAFDFVENRASTLLIEPLIVMEQSLFNVSYLGLRENLEDAWNIVSELRMQCKRHNGNFTILWHNSELVDSELREFYAQCIK